MLKHSTTIHPGPWPTTKHLVRYKDKASLIRKFKVMHIPKEIQKYIMTFMIHCETCTKHMIDSRENTHELVHGGGFKDIPFHYWDTNGTSHVICNQCYWNELT